MSPPARLLVDLSQFVSHPVASGVQRVLRHLLDRPPVTRLIPLVGFLRDGQYRIVQTSVAVNALESLFSREHQAPPSTYELATDLECQMSASVMERWPVEQVPFVFDGYFLPEPVLRADVVTAVHRFLDISTFPVASLYYDAIPVVAPQHFPRAAVLAFDRYLRACTRCNNVAFISDTVRREFEQRFARRRVPNALVCHLGAEPLEEGVRQVRQPPTFVVPGTLEPRKRPDVALAAAESLWRSGHEIHLTFVGAAGPMPDSFYERLRHAVSTGRVRWVENPTDRQLSLEFLSASAVVFISQLEGYGLPVIEALRLGCPVIVAADLPVLESVDAGGQIRLEAVTPETLGDALMRLCDAEVNLGVSRAAAALTVPDWTRFRQQLWEWLENTIQPMVLRGSHPGVPGT